MSTIKLEIPTRIKALLVCSSCKREIRDLEFCDEVTVFNKLTGKSEIKYYCSNCWSIKLNKSLDKGNKND